MHTTLLAKETLMLGYFVNSRTAVIETSHDISVNPLQYVNKIVALLQQNGNVKSHYAISNGIVLNFNNDVIKYAIDQQRLLLKKRDLTAPAEYEELQQQEETPEEAAEKFRKEEGLTRRQEQELIAPHPTYIQEISPEEEKAIERRRLELEKFRNKDIIFAVSKDTDDVYLIIRKEKTDLGQDVYILRDSDGNTLEVSANELNKNFRVTKRQKSKTDEPYAVSLSREEDITPSEEETSLSEQGLDEENATDDVAERIKRLKKRDLDPAGFHDALPQIRRFVEIQKTPGFDERAYKLYDKAITNPNFNEKAYYDFQKWISAAFAKYEQEKKAPITQDAKRKTTEKYLAKNDIDSTAYWSWLVAKDRIDKDLYKKWKRVKDVDRKFVQEYIEDPSDPFAGALVFNYDGLLKFGFTKKMADTLAEVPVGEETTILDQVTGETINVTKQQTPDNKDVFLINTGGELKAVTENSPEVAEFKDTGLIVNEAFTKEQVVKVAQILGITL